MVESTPTDISQKHLTRRTLAKGAAWSVPAIALATAAPAMAASGIVPVKVIEFIGVTSANAAGSATLPSGWQAGDLAIWMGTRWGATSNTAAPNTPTGYTKVGPTVSNKPGTFWTTSAAAYRVLQASDTVMPASSYAHDAVLVVYRNATIGAVNGASCGTGACLSGASFPALSLQVSTGTSWVAGLASNNKSVTATGLVARANPGTGAMSALDTNGGVASWATHPATSAQHAFSLELKLAP